MTDQKDLSMQAIRYVESVAMDLSKYIEAHTDDIDHDLPLICDGVAIAKMDAVIESGDYTYEGEPEDTANVIRKWCEMHDATQHMIDMFHLGVEYHDIHNNHVTGWPYELDWTL